MQKIVFVDCETTGLNPDTDQIISYCAVQWNSRQNVGPSVGSLVMPTIEPPDEVKAINRFDRSMWAKCGAKAYSHVDAAKLADILDAAIIAGSNPSFDRAFIASEAKRLGFESPRWTHRSIDIASLAAPLLVIGELEKTGLEHVAKFLGVSLKDYHDAVTDTYIAIECFERLLDLYLGDAWQH